MTSISRAERELLDKHGIWESHTRLESGPHIKVDPHKRMVSVLIVGCILDCQDVEGHKHPIDWQQNCFIPLVHL